MSRSEGRARAPFRLSEVIDLDQVSQTDADEETQLADVLARAPRSIRRKMRARLLRQRRKGRLNYRVGVTELLVDLLCCDEFFELAAECRLPRRKFGPEREYNEIGIFLYQALYGEFDSFREIEAFLRDPLVWDIVRVTLETAWPDRPDRRVASNPTSRSQFHRCRRQLQAEAPDAKARLIAALEGSALKQALAQGYFEPGRGSIAHPDLRDVARGDGTFFKARFDAVEGDKSEDPITGETHQARYDRDAALGRDDSGDLSPGYRWVVFHADTPEEEQEAVILCFGRALEGGEPKVAAELLARLRAALPGCRHYLYDMALQGLFVNMMYPVGLHPITKLPRNAKGEPANALIEYRDLPAASGRTITVTIYGLDGVAGILTVADGRELFVPLTPIAVRERPGGRVAGEYQIPDHPVVHPDLRGRTLQIRLDGLTVLGRQRSQYLRWINEHTPAGQRLLPQRNATESQNNIIEHTLDFGRARSVGEFNCTLDLVGYTFTRNLRAALAFRRRTGRDSLTFADRPSLRAAAA